MAYVDGFVLSVPKDKLGLYEELARKGAAILKELGALSVTECVADDVPYGELTSFPRAVHASDDEIVIFSWVTYPSRGVRDEANAKFMADPRVKEQMAQMPADGKRMIFGGFKTLVEA